MADLYPVGRLPLAHQLLKLRVAVFVGSLVAFFFEEPDYSSIMPYG